MATNFPASLDTLTNPTSSDSLSSPSHSAQHANVNDAVEALQAKVGADSSAVTSSLDYKVAQLETLGTLTAFTPSWTNFTPGNATESWYYTQVQDFVYIQGTTVLGSTSSVTGAITLANPAGGTVVSTLTAQGLFEYTESGGVRAYGSSVVSGGAFVFVYFSVSGSLIARTTTSATVPFTWGTGDILRGWMAYQLS